MSERVLVTGGAGFIGSHLVEGLTNAGYTVRILDDLSTGLRENLAHLSKAPEFIHGDVANFEDVQQAVQGCSVVYHLAAMASVARSLEEPLLCHAICATGTLNVLVAATQAKARRIVYAGSSSAYGMASDPAGQDEQTPLMPLSPYASAKLAGEHYLQAYAHSFPIETVRLRFFNIFGPRQRADSPYSGVIAIFTAILSEGRVPVVHGDGLQARDFTYVENAVNAVILAGNTPGISGQVYNVGTGRSVNLLELAQALNQALGTNITPTHGPERVGDVRFSLAKIDKISRELNYQPNICFADGLKRTIDWYQSLKS